MEKDAIEIHFERRDKIRLLRDTLNRLHQLFATPSDSFENLWAEANRGSEAAYESLQHLAGFDNLEEVPSRRSL